MLMHLQNPATTTVRMYTSATSLVSRKLKCTWILDPDSQLHTSMIRVQDPSLFPALLGLAYTAHKGLIPAKGFLFNLSNIQHLMPTNINWELALATIIPS